MRKARAVNILLITEAALEYFVAILVSGAFLARITMALDIPDGVTGILTAVASLGSLFKLLSAVFFGGARVKRRVILFDMASGLLAVGVYAAALLPIDRTASVVIFVLFLLSHYIILNSSATVKFTWLISLIEDRRRGRFSAAKEIVSLACGAAFTYAVGARMDALDALNRSGEAMELCAVLIVILFVLHTAVLIFCPESDTESAPTGGVRAMLALIGDRKMRALLGLSALVGIAQCVSIPFMGTYQLAELSFSMSDVARMSLLYSVVRMALSPFMGKMADRRGFARMMLICLGLMSASFVVGSFVSPANGRILYAVYYSLYAMAMAGLNSASFNLVFDYIPRDKCASALALYAATGGLCGFIATLTAGAALGAVQSAGGLFGGAMYAQQGLNMSAALFGVVALIYLDRVIVKGIRRADE